jgi:hypothetical protein
LQGIQGVAGSPGAQGQAGPPGFGSSAALASALAMPVWLESRENFAISGGLGFDQFGMGFGATGVMRLNQNLSVFLGGAIVPSTQTFSGRSEWGGKVGGRVGW